MVSRIALEGRQLNTRKHLSEDVTLPWKKKNRIFRFGGSGEDPSSSHGKLRDANSFTRMQPLERMVQGTAPSPLPDEGAGDSQMQRYMCHFHFLVF